MLSLSPRPFTVRAVPYLSLPSCLQATQWGTVCGEGEEGWWQPHISTSFPKKRYFSRG